MTRKIYKYQLELQGTIQGKSIPLRAKIIHVAAQYGENICMWAEFDTEYEHNTVYRKFQIVGTGHDILDERLQYVGTATCDSGFVWHIYEEINENCT